MIKETFSYFAILLGTPEGYFGTKSHLIGWTGLAPKLSHQILERLYSPTL